MCKIVLEIDLSLFVWWEGTPTLPSSAEGFSADITEAAGLRTLPSVSPERELVWG